MDGFEINKILGAILGTALLIIGISNVANAIYKVEPLKQDAYPVEVAENTGGAAATPKQEVDLGTALAGANLKKGEQIARGKCTACHTLDKGQPPATGPNLYGVVGGPVIRPEEHFNYSSAMQKFGGEWTFERLWTFLANPREDISGTAMTFVGLPKESERADVIAWLNSNSDKPAALPAPKQAADAAPAADAVTPPAASSTATEAPAGEAPASSASAPPAGEAPKAP